MVIYVCYELVVTTTTTSALLFTNFLLENTNATKYSGMCILLCYIPHEVYGAEEKLPKL